MYKFKAYINGEFIDTTNHVEVLSPETEQVVGTVPALSKSQIKEIFVIAKQAQKAWAITSREYRCNILIKYANLLEKHSDEIANIMVDEIAKAYNSSIGEVNTAIKYIRAATKWYLEEKETVLTEKDHGIKGKRAYLKYKPHGVIVSISPFNFPVNLAITKFVPALLTGNAVVFKGATSGCLTAAKLTELLHEAGIPKGVFNNATGKGSEIGDELITNKHVSGISFTGSTPVGKRIATLVSKIPVVLELGGKGPAIVREDADIDLAVDKIIIGGFNFSGQRCTAIKRVLVHTSIKDKLIAKLVEKTKNLSVGKAKDNCVITAIIDAKHRRYLKGLAENAKSHGGNFNGFTFKNEGNLIYPMIISDVTQDMDIYYKEQFGPILPVIDFSSDEEAITIANDSIYGLQASIFTKDIKKAHQMALQIESGSVNFNSFPQSGPIQLPFLGVKDSGHMTQGLTYSINNMRHEFNVVEND